MTRSNISLFFRLISTKSPYGWFPASFLDHKCSHLLCPSCNTSMKIILTLRSFWENIPIVCWGMYWTPNHILVFNLQACIWVCLWWSPSSVVLSVAKIFFAGMQFLPPFSMRIGWYFCYLGITFSMHQGSLMKLCMEFASFGRCWLLTWIIITHGLWWLQLCH